MSLQSYQGETVSSTRTQKHGDKSSEGQSGGNCVHCTNGLCRQLL